MKWDVWILCIHADFQKGALIKLLALEFLFLEVWMVGCVDSGMCG